MAENQKRTFDFDHHLKICQTEISGVKAAYVVKLAEMLFYHKNFVVDRMEGYERKLAAAVLKIEELELCQTTPKTQTTVEASPSSITRPKSSTESSGAATSTTIGSPSGP